MAGWRVDHQCPQCGAPVTLAESDRLFICPYCRVCLYLATPGACRYYLPPADRDDDELFYVPYWRAKGMLFSCRGHQIAKRLLDTSIRAVEIQGFPQSLGFRPQSLPLRFVTPEVSGSFLAVETPLKTSVEDLHRRRLAAGSGKMDFSAFIGEECSLIYAPVKRVGENHFQDAIDSKKLPGISAASLDDRLQKEPLADSALSFVPALCPACGWDLKGERDSLVLLCDNCHTAWKASLAGLQPVLASVFPPEDKQGILQIPFWRLRVEIDGLEIHSYADLVRQANLPKMIEPAWNERPASFWVPAFKIQPRLFLRLAKNMTIIQPSEEPECHIDASRFYPVTMTANEASESLAVLLATMILPRQRIFPLLPHLHITLHDARLMFQPFKLQGPDIIEPHSSMALNRNALRWGRSI